MIDFRNIEGIYFVGIGGIGMSALAVYYALEGYTIAGYDRSKTNITDKLNDLGCEISFSDDTNTIPRMFKDTGNRGNVIIIYTPAIPAENRVFSYFKENGYGIFKRSEVLGQISSATDTIAIAGTHGKTTVSAMTAHLFKQSHIDCSAFLGGISKNYDSNLLVGDGRYTVIEADEYDRSFHRLSPLIAVITAADPDHLEIYGDLKTMIAGYNEFCKRIRTGGILVINNRIKDIISRPEGIECFTYGSSPDSDYRYTDIEHRVNDYSFNLKTPDNIITDLHFPFPGIINIENMTAAIAVALRCGISEDELRKAVLIFQGVRRRFDIRVNIPGLAYVDDYAHHPEEIRACIHSLREYFRGRRITGIFQPHLFSRTLNHSAGFAEILDQLDEVILLPVYPAREKPVLGVTSELIFNKMKNGHKQLMELEDVTEKLDIKKLDVLVTIGAGNIDTLVEPIEKKLKTERQA
jgi:UDP-N-acetylmuramate--alanine ligase